MYVYNFYGRYYLEIYVVFNSKKCITYMDAMKKIIKSFCVCEFHLTVE